MNKELLEQRLSKYSGLKFDIREPVVETSTIEWQGVRLSNIRYGPLWCLFVRYRDDKLTEKDLKYIDFIEDDEVEDDVVTVDEKLLPLHQYIENKLKDNISASVRLERLLFGEHTSTIKGYVHEIKKETYVLYDDRGRLREVAFKDIVDYKI